MTAGRSSKSLLYSLFLHSFLPRENSETEVLSQEMKENGEVSRGKKSASCTVAPESRPGMQGTEMGAM